MGILTSDDSDTLDPAAPEPSDNYVVSEMPRVRGRARLICSWFLRYSVVEPLQCNTRVGTSNHPGPPGSDLVWTGAEPRFCFSPTRGPESYSEKSISRGLTMKWRPLWHQSLLRRWVLRAEGFRHIFVCLGMDATDCLLWKSCMVTNYPKERICVSGGRIMF
jgi:hypothetical protein